ncbi:hypothetical protein GCK72_006173 [Caenorhabditis remanei]|uniref:DUF19 domain-containing protein n=1 Tax=Caenorhabditis remanei TaxID=31234 RepID=A0A6A5HHN0_CAERE|nr:hypothetical protein GCK72_006173 [Caenorhabditis remanei]KAF1766217.1 hypothetical protein GCK72_006173 [Caenorhabditis remanei]
MSLPSFIIILIFVIPELKSLDVDLGGLVKQTVAGNERALHNCSVDQDQVLQQCYINMFISYGLNVTSLPSAEDDPFKSIRYDATGMCSSYSALRHCHSDVIDSCLNYNTFNAIFGSESNAAYYISQTAFLQFYCDYGADFVAYYECMQAVSLNDLTDTIYTECSVLEVGSCEFVVSVETSVYSRIFSAQFLVQHNANGQLFGSHVERVVSNHTVNIRRF